MMTRTVWWPPAGSDCWSWNPGPRRPVRKFKCKRTQPGPIRIVLKSDYTCKPPRHHDVPDNI